MPISAARAFYIKLGEEGKWEHLCFADNTLRLGYFEVPNELGHGGAVEPIRAIYSERGMTAGVATGHASQVLNFYDFRDDTLWVTFANGKLYWCFAEPAVEYIGASERDHGKVGSRLRRCVGAWSSRTEGGDELRIADLHCNLTKTAGYRQTICAIKPADARLSRSSHQRR